MNMSFWKELFDLITDLPQHPDALVKIIALLLGLSIIFCALYSHIVGIFTIKYMIASIISALYFIFSVIWMLYYIDNTIMGMMPGFVLILLVLICIVSSFFIIRKEGRLKKHIVKIKNEEWDAKIECDSEMNNVTMELEEL